MLGAENRYSTFVSMAKIIMPIVGLGMLSSMFLINRTPDQSEAIPYSDVELNEILHGQRLGAPEFRGTLEDRSQVLLNADQAQPDPQNNDIINAVGVSGIITQLNGAIITLDTPTGIYDQTQRFAEGHDGVVVTHSSGYTLTSDVIRAEMDTLDIKTQSKVVIVGPNIRLEAGRMHLREQGRPGSEHVDFTLGVKLVYTPTSNAEK